MQIAAAGTGVRLSDGSTNVLPVGSKGAVQQAWRLHARLVRRSLERAFYQGWDLHPAQLPTRFAATYGFYREALPAAAARLRAYLDKVASQGGKTVIPVTEIPGTVKFAQFADPEGNIVGLLDSTYQPQQQ